MQNFHQWQFYFLPWIKWWLRMKMSLRHGLWWDSVAAGSNHPVTRRGSVADAGAQATSAGTRQELNSTCSRKGWKLISHEFKNVTFSGSSSKGHYWWKRNISWQEVKMEQKHFPHFLQTFLLDDISNFFLNLLWSVVMVACNYMV